MVLMNTHIQQTKIDKLMINEYDKNRHTYTNAIIHYCSSTTLVICN